MSQFQKEIVQAVLIADNNVWNFKPLSDEGSTVSTDCTYYWNAPRTLLYLFIFGNGKYKYMCMTIFQQALLPLVNVSMLDYALIALNRSGVEEVFVYASLFLQDIREHIK